jgi:hypothetical protein
VPCPALVTDLADALATGGGLEPSGREVLSGINEYGSNLEVDREMIPSISLLQGKAAARTLPGEAGIDLAQEEGELSLLSTDTLSHLTESGSPSMLVQRDDGRVATALAGTLVASGVEGEGVEQRVDLLRDIPGAQRAKRTKMEA